MNTVVNKEPDSAVDSTLKKFLSFKIGIIPMSVYLFLLAVVFGLLHKQLMPKDIIGGLSLMALYGFTCAEFGKRIPLLKHLGGNVIMATFLPSYLVFANMIPKAAITSISTFMKTSNFLYVFIAFIVVGSIFSMNRQVLIKAFLKMFVPLVVGTIVAMAVGVGVGVLLGIDAHTAFFYIVIPILAGGVGEGALPLAMGYSSILGQEQDAIFASVLPCVMLGSLTAIVLSGVLNMIGKKYPQYSGNGSLVKEGDDEILRLAKEGEKAKQDVKIDLEKMIVAALVAFGLYLFGIVINTLIGLPAPIVMLVTAVIVKAMGIIPENIVQGAHALFKFTVTGLTVPLLLGVGVAMTPWKNIIAVITNPSYLIVIFFTVVSLVATAWFVGKAMNMNPVEASMVVACHSGQGGTGDVAILTAGNRLELMPFAQVSTRLGGVANVTLAIALLRMLQG